ncbi:hypothetical protein KQX54_015067 [Cotesia glomerata]|uniref:Uncharacterized protein n=1 Tax=Cotesia glomerata TaxID=32391 RepID=A0AAV7IT35_COTGL|nr:hypothetical protein KQX54_015067 [Cotesia glomerata]
MDDTLPILVVEKVEGKRQSEGARGRLTTSGEEEPRPSDREEASPRMSNKERERGGIKAEVPSTSSTSTNQTGLSYLSTSCRAWMIAFRA